MSEQQRTINPENLPAPERSELVAPEPATSAELDERRNQSLLANETLKKERSADLDEARANVHDIFGDQSVPKDQIYFHGSNHPLEIGDVIKPGDRAYVGKDGRPNASATRDETTAWSYAIGKEAGSHGYQDPKSKVKERGRVYKVVPSDGRPVEQLGGEFEEVNSPSFTVVGVEDVQPGQQGTIPGVNWKEYIPHDDANHPKQQYQDHEPEGDHEEPYQDNPNDVPLPGFGEDEQIVRNERERVGQKSGDNDITAGMVF